LPGVEHLLGVRRDLQNSANRLLAGAAPFSLSFLDRATHRTLGGHSVRFARGVESAVFAPPLIRISKVGFDGIVLALLTFPPTARMKVIGYSLTLGTFDLICARHKKLALEPQSIMTSIESQYRLQFQYYVSEAGVDFS
jgi:hypothetical protein